MGRLKRQYDEWTDRLAAGGVVLPEEELVAAFISSLRSPSADSTVGKTLPAAVAAEALDVAENSEARRTKSRHAEPLTIKWRRRVMVSAFLSTLFGKLAAGGLALAIVASGAAATGSLPDAAQQHVSDALAKAGIHVPAPDQLAGDADAEGENESNVSHEPAGPVLPESASDTAKSVTATVFGSELTGRAFGEAVAAAAKGRASREATRAVPTISAAPAVQEKPTVPAIPTTPSIPPDPR